MRADRLSLHLLVAAVAATLLVACVGEVTGTATFFGEVVVPRQAQDHDLRLVAIAVSGRAPTEKCPDGADFRESFSEVAVVTSEGKFKSPQFELQDSFKTKPEKCGSVPFNALSAEQVKLWIGAKLPPTHANCKGFCDGRCKVTEVCAADCVTRCLQAKSIVGHSEHPRITEGSTADAVAVVTDLVFDTLER
jgi:hypothetical protein